MKKNIFIFSLTLILLLGAVLAQDGRYITVDSNHNLKVITNDADKVTAASLQKYPDKRVYADMDTVLPIIHADDMQNAYGLSGNGVTVCIIDTGIDDTLDQFSLRIVDQACFCDDSIPEDGVGCCPNGQEQDTDAEDENGHGTHVSGILGGNDDMYMGVAPGVDIVAVRVLDDAGEGYLSDVLKGMDYCVENAASLGIDVISMSLGTSDLYDSVCDDELTLMTDIVDTGYAGGVMFIASSGNEGSETSVRMPACLQNVLAVGSSTDSDSMSTFTNTGPLLDLVAPGEQVYSVVPGGSYSPLSGTSMSAPQAAGAAALLLEAQPFLSVSELKSALLTSDTSIEGYPRLDLMSAYDYVSENEIPEFGTIGAIIALVGAAIAIVTFRRK